ncbi:MAG: hypothetical protein K2R93_01325 [Gemmatimonadaceae bacterium]|nr:hypothetical protein [Gemmatimonadaceae bacterium]
MAAPRSSPRWQDLVDAAFAVGTLTTIATGGALLGLGIRDGEAGRAFRLAGRGLLESIGVPSLSAPLTSVALGYLHHLLVATAWGVLLALLVLPQRGLWRLAAAVVAAAVYSVVSASVLPALLRIGYGVTGTIPGAVPVGVAMALSLVGGAWVAADASPADD